MKPRPWRRRLLLAVASCCGGLAVGEVGLRLAGFRIAPPVHVGEREDRPSKNFAPDPELGWRMRPGHAFIWKGPDGEPVRYCADGEGLRVDCESGKPGGPAEPGSSRVLLFAGDSFTWGSDVPYDATFPALCGAALDASVRNVAMPGFGLDQVWLSVRRELARETPSLVVIGLFYEDFERSRHAYRPGEGFNKPRFELRDGTLAQRTAAENPGPLVRALERQSRIWMFGRAVLRNAGRHLPIGEWWTLNEAILDAVRADCAAAGVPVLFVHVPSERWRAFPMLARYMQENEAHYLDPVQLSARPPGDLYLDDEPMGHFNPAGHRWLSGQIERHVREGALLSAE